MAKVPSSYTSAASVSRSKTSREDTRSIADAMLRSSLSDVVSSPAPSAPKSSASISRSEISRDKLNEMLRSSVSSSRSALPASLPSAPPSYRTKLSTTRAPVLDSSKLTSIKSDSVRLRKLQLQQEVDRANAALPRRNTAGLFKAACSTDLLFLIDTTGSMGSYIDSAKQQVKSIVADIKDAFLGECQVRIAVVGYKDHNDTPNIQFLDFTSSADEVRIFLDTLRATGGGDLPEDVLGGIQQALHASWKQQTRCIVHIADAPSHGCELHDLSEDRDDYYSTGSEPHGLVHQPLLRKLIRLNINYALLRITPHTNRMALAFACVYGDGNARLLKVNTYSSQVNKDLTGRSGASKNNQGSATIGTNPQFEEMQLGTTYSQLRHLVVKTVTNSFSRSAGRLTIALSREADTSGIRSPSGVLSPDFSIIREEDESASTAGVEKVALETALPQWTTPGWLNNTLEVEGFAPAVVVHSASTLNDMMAADENIKLDVAKLTIFTRSEPFAQGALRTASYARTAASTSRFVVKSFIRDGHSRADVAEDMRIQALCKAFALEFNSLVKVEPPLDFVVTSCLETKRGSSLSRQGGCISLEPFLDGKYVKYNSNNAWVNEELADDQFNQMAQTFSHFTFERSFGHFLVNDLQGVDHLLTDPSIQTRDPERFKLANTNLGEDGFKFFFVSHVCNSVCTKLGLKSSRATLLSGKLDFRERWPTMEPTVCCSNMFCRRVIRMASARHSETYPSLHWCETCFSQLQSSTSKWICIEAGPNHEFEVNRYFHESQGQHAPRKCPSHLEKDSAVLGAASVGGSLWNRMKAAEPTGSISGRSW